MEDILYDYHIGKAMVQLGDYADRDYKQSLYLEAVLAKHDVSRADFDSSLVYYYSHSELFTDIYKQVSERLENEAKRLGATEGELNMYNTFSANGDTANIWNGNLNAVLIPKAPYNRMDFSIEVDTTFRVGDTFMLNFVNNFVYQSGAKDAVACLTAKYENDSIISQVVHVSVSGVTQLRLNSPVDQKIKYIRGFIYLSDTNDVSSTVRIMFIDNIHLIRFHLPKDAAAPAQTDSIVTDTLRADSTARVPNAAIRKDTMTSRARLGLRPSTR